MNRNDNAMNRNDKFAVDKNELMRDQADAPNTNEGELSQDDMDQVSGGLGAASVNPAAATNAASSDATTAGTGDNPDLAKA